MVHEKWNYQSCLSFKNLLFKHILRECFSLFEWLVRLPFPFDRYQWSSFHHWFLARQKIAAVTKCLVSPLPNNERTNRVHCSTACQNVVIFITVSHVYNFIFSSRHAMFIYSPYIIFENRLFHAVVWRMSFSQARIEPFSKASYTVSIQSWKHSYRCGLSMRDRKSVV